MNVQTRPGRPRMSAALAGAYITLFAVAPPAALADPATAPGPHTLEVKLSLADLDLATAEGVRAAHERLRAKAQYLCRQLWDDNSASFRWTYAACVKETLANAVQQLNARRFAAVHRPRAEP